MRSALFLPVFDELSDARVVADLAAQAEGAGWDGVFVWDHIAYRAPVREVADPWVVLAAMAMTTERILLGPMVTPLARRRPVKLAREIATLDRLSGGRLVLGVGLGGDGSRELSATGEQVDDRVRARMLDEALEVLRDGVDRRAGAPRRRALRRRRPDAAADAGAAPRPAGVGGAAAGQPRAAAPGGAPRRRVPDRGRVARAAGGAGRRAARLRGDDPRPFDLVVGGPPGTDPAPYAAAGATWWTVSFPVGTTVADVRAVLARGPGGL